LQLQFITTKKSHQQPYG